MNVFTKLAIANKCSYADENQDRARLQHALINTQI